MIPKDRDEAIKRYGELNVYCVDKARRMMGESAAAVYAKLFVSYQRNRGNLVKALTELTDYQPHELEDMLDGFEDALKDFYAEEIDQ